MMSTSSREPKNAAPAGKKAGGDGQPAVEQLESELAETREELEKTIAELEAANEELRVSNEKMSAMNEELNTVNAELRASERKYRNIAESMPGMILKYKLNPDGTDRLLFISKGVADLFEVSHEDAVSNNRLLWNRIHKDDLAEYVASIKESAANLSFWEQEHRIQLPGGRVKWIHCRGVPNRQEDGSIVWDTLAIDVTERKKAMEKLRRSQAMLARTERIAHIGSWEWEIATDTVTWSEGLYRIFKMDLHDKAPSWAEHEELYHPEDMQRLRRAVETALSEIGSYRLELRALRRDGKIRTCLATGFPETDAKGNVVRLVGYLQDITERKQREAELNETKALLEATGRMARVGGWELDSKASVVKWTEETCRIHEVPLDYQPSLEEAILFYPTEAREPLTRAVQKALDHGTPYDMELPFLTAKGQRLWARTICRPEVVDGKTVKLSGTFQDITDRKHAELALQDALTEKEALLREIHHRVKNNMQVIVGFLRMHARRAGNPDLTKAFDDCRDRIEAMSLVHEALYQSDDLARIDFAAYLKKLCRNLGQAHDARGRGVALTANARDVTLNMDQAVAVGMIIAELISNAFKHAFPHNEGGTVSVHLDRPDGETVQLIVSDTGKGAPDDFGIRNPSSLGMKLVSGAVTRELGGTIDMERENGTRFIIRFK